MFTREELENLLQDDHNVVILEGEYLVGKISLFKANGFKVFAPDKVTYRKVERTWSEWWVQMWTAQQHIENWKTELSTDVWMPPYDGVFRIDTEDGGADYVIKNRESVVRLRLDHSERLFKELVGCGIVREWIGEYGVLEEAETIARERGYTKFAVFTNNKEVLKALGYSEAGYFMIKEFDLVEHYVANV